MHTTRAELFSSFGFHKKKLDFPQKNYNSSLVYLIYETLKKQNNKVSLYKSIDCEAEIFHQRPNL
jgi:hypothetical protein